jgi:uncharacterized Tic20 family protein
MKLILTSEERVWAVLSHLSALAFGMGIALPVIGWSEQRGKSKFAAFQALQALGYQSLGFTLWLLVELILGIVLMVILMFSLSEMGNQVLLNVLFMGLLIVIVLVSGLYIILPIVVAIQCALGKEIHYPVLGSRLARYLGYSSATDDSPVDEEHEDRWVAAMGHLAVINVFWGMLAPLTAWIVQGKRNTFLMFQSIQTLVFQAVSFVLLIFATFLLTGGSLIFALSMSAISLNSESLSTPSILLGGVVYLATQLCAVAFFAFVPAFHVLGQWAGYRILKGDDYRYPVIGKLVERQVLKFMKPSAEENIS